MKLCIASMITPLDRDEEVEGMAASAYMAAISTHTWEQEEESEEEEPKPRTRRNRRAA